MSRDYKKRARTKKTARRSAPPWAWVTLGVAIGLFAGFLFWLSGRPPATLKLPALPRPAAPPPVARHATPPAPPETARESAPPRFDFYTLLPKLEVVVPGQHNPPAARIHPAQPAPSQPPQKIERPGSYLLQAGSFRTYAEANRMKASLALLGYVSTISKVEVRGQTWYRVQIGPFNRLDALNATREALAKHHISTLAIKVSG